MFPTCNIQCNQDWLMKIHLMQLWRQKKQFWSVISTTLSLQCVLIATSSMYICAYLPLFCMIIITSMRIKRIEMYNLILYHRVVVMREARNLKVFQTVSMVTHLIRTGTCLDMATVCCTHDVLMRYHMAQMFRGRETPLNLANHWWFTKFYTLNFNNVSYDINHYLKCLEVCM